ncbi:MAG: hypothetical protein M0Z99_11350 [Betaproteobacteria bacterium]|nr:hypothetical protein [Betaproteobacteria bacterium]
MSSQVSAPVTTTVIAIDIAGADSFEASVLENFDQAVVAARKLGFVTQESGKPNLTLTLAPELEIGNILEQLAQVAAGFDAVATPLRLRGMVHRGVVFRTEDAGQVSYVGSAIRSTQSALRRAPATGGLMATPDFSAYAAKLPKLPFRLQAIGGGAFEGMNHIVFGSMSVAPPRAGNQLPSADPEFVDFVKRRLAAEIGPFASALVDRAIRSSTVADQLVSLLSRDIDNPEARVRFEDEMLQYIKARAIAR